MRSVSACGVCERRQCLSVALVVRTGYSWGCGEMDPHMPSVGIKFPDSNFIREPERAEMKPGLVPFIYLEGASYTLPRGASLCLVCFS